MTRFMTKQFTRQIFDRKQRTTTIDLQTADLGQAHT